jgi:hypothetical protein
MYRVPRHRRCLVLVIHMLEARDWTIEKTMGIGHGHTVLFLSGMGHNLRTNYRDLRGDVPPECMESAK